MDNQWKRNSKKFNDLQDGIVKCKCGHSVLLNNVEKTICSWCGNYVFKDKSKEFEYRLNESIKRSERNENSNERI